MNRCRRCWRKIKDWKLWCDECSSKVDEELKEDKVRPLEYYFKYYLKHVKPKK